MKHKLFVVLFTLVSTLTQAQDLTWHTDVNKAVTESNKTKKPLFMFFTGSDWCGWCIRLQKEVFSQPEFIKWAKKNVILVELDFPRKNNQPENIKIQNQQIQQAFGVQGYPTVWFVNATVSNGKTNFTPIGSMGYKAGGPAAWLRDANTILTKK